MGVGGQQRGSIGGTTVKCYETSTRMGDWMVPTCFFLSKHMSNNERAPQVKSGIADHKQGFNILKIVASLLLIYYKAH